MSFRLSYSNFKLLNDYLDKKAKGCDMTLSEINNTLEIKFFNIFDEQCVITLFEEVKDGTGTSFPKIAVTRRLGDEIK